VLDLGTDQVIRVIDGVACAVDERGGGGRPRPPVPAGARLSEIANVDGVT
jgi:hypothetical protein